MVSAASVGKFLVSQRLGAFVPPFEPGFDPEARALFEKHIRIAKLYVEFGSGGSTMRAAQLDVPTLSIESDRFFAKQMTRALGRDCSVRILHVEIGITHAWGWPVFTRPTEQRLARWRDYSSAPWALVPAGAFPDFILIDGRFRRACALKAASRIAGSGHQSTLMFDDYFNEGREDYHSIERCLGKPSRIGRAAFFALNAKTGRPTEAELLEANSDPR